jgi:hypothetical protein
MSFDDFKRAAANGGGTEPTDGVYSARLEHTAVLDTRNGKRIKTEWRTVDGAHAWDAWNGVEGGQARFGVELIEALGVTIAGLGSWEQLQDALLDCEERVYTVRVEVNGNFRNTYVEDRLPGGAAAPAVPPDIPVDTQDFEDVVPAAPSDADDLFDDVPF